MNIHVPAPAPVPASQHRATTAKGMPVKTRLIWRRTRIISLALQLLVVTLVIAISGVVALVWLDGMTSQLPPCSSSSTSVCSGPPID
jgi:hypothetical protein